MLLLLLYFLTVDDLPRIGKKSKEKCLSKNGLKRWVEVTIHLSCGRGWRNGCQPSADGVLAQSKRAICVCMRASAERQMCERIKSWWREIKTPFESHFVVKYYTFPLKMFSMTKVGGFLRRFSVVDFSAVDFLDFLKAVRLNTKNYCSWFFSKQRISLAWFPTHGFTYQRGNMISCFKKSEKWFYTQGLFISALFKLIAEARVNIYATNTRNQCFYGFRRKI